LSKSNINWQAVEADPRFARLHRDKTRFLSRMMLFALIFFFCLPIATAYFQPLLKIKVWGVINIALLFALAQFMVAWGIAFIYAKRANAQFDAEAQALIDDAHHIKGII
jgi:uncharacterized membrane protein (DUF485 family)